MIYKINILWCVIVSPMYYCACKLVPFNAFMLENCFAWLCIAFEYLFSLNIVRLIVACVQISQKARKHIWLVDECCWVMMSDDDDNYTIPILYLYYTYTMHAVYMQYTCSMCSIYIYICVLYSLRLLLRSSTETIWIENKSDETLRCLGSFAVRV